MVTQVYKSHLIIPILYVETPSLKDPDDLIANDLNSRQRFDWTIYRFEDLGSDQARRGLAELASQITTAIERSRQSASDPIIPYEDPNTEGLGFLEVLAATEEAFPALTLTISSLGETTHQISDLIAKATEEINFANSSGKPTSARLSIVHRLSRRLEEPVRDMESLAEDYLDQVAQVGSGIALFVERVPYLDQEERVSAGTLLDSLELMRRASIQTFESLRTYQDSIVETYPISSALRPILKRLHKALAGVITSRQTFESWHTDFGTALDLVPEQQ